jgi:anti-sigma regulatory factor (Ser/Thr protein kinase)
MEWTVEPGAAPGPIRREIRSYLRDRGVDARLEDAEIVVGELLANMLRHTLAGGRVNVDVDHEHGVVRLEVFDFGVHDAFAHKWPALDEHHPPELDRQDGRGLWIARHVADDLRVNHQPSGTAVEARFQIGGNPLDV